MRLPYGVLKTLSEKTGLPKNYLSDLAARRCWPGREQAIVLEGGCKEIGLAISKEEWVFAEKTVIRASLSKFSMNNFQNTTASPA